MAKYGNICVPNHCSECGKEISLGLRKCQDCSRKALSKIFSEDPELKKAFLDTLDEMRKPETIAELASKIQPALDTISELKKQKRGNTHDGR